MNDPSNEEYVLSIVLLEPPAPAARVLLGLALAIFSFWSAAARRRIAVRGPPGMAEGEEGRPMLAPLAAAASGEAGRGEDCKLRISSNYKFGDLKSPKRLRIARLMLS